MYKMADSDSPLVDLYDLDNPDGPDHDFYRELADQLGARSIIDVGCGTGILTVTLAGHGRSVLGVDPSQTMLDYARNRPGADRARWMFGDSRDIDVRNADFVVMSGNVAQHIVGDAWPRTLADINRALRRGGVVAFESRNPGARAWETWDAAQSTTRETQHGPLTEWAEVSGLRPNGHVSLTFHNLFERTGDHVVEALTLAFRDRETIEHELRQAGFTVEAVWGDWVRTPFKGSDTTMIFQARKP